MKKALNIFSWFSLILLLSSGIIILINENKTTRIAYIVATTLVSICLLFDVLNVEKLIYKIIGIIGVIINFAYIVIFTINFDFIWNHYFIVLLMDFIMIIPFFIISSTQSKLDK